MKNKLDFIIIGAQKSGTTTLFQLLKQHANIFLPPEKEAFFFGRPEREENGWAWYIKEFFGDASEDKLWGTITPHYMAYQGIAPKIHKIMPQAKIIAILREPFSRTYSQYLMLSRRKNETRDYLQCVTNLSADHELINSRNDISETNSYIVRSEYGRILLNYKKEFGLQNMLVLFTDDLENSPQQVLDRICDFLKVPYFHPEGIGKKFHRGGSGKPKSILVTKLINSIKKSEFLKKIIKRAISFKHRRKFIFQIYQWNTSSKTIHENEIDPHDIEKAINILKPIFLDDAELFAREFNMKFPWDEKLK